MTGTHNIAVVGANGKAGSLIVREALKRGFTVTAITRSPNATNAQHSIQSDVRDLEREQVASFDTVVDAVGGWDDQTYGQIPDASAHLADIVSNTDTRLIVVGGAGSLFVDQAHSATLSQGADFPDAFKGVAAAHQVALDNLRGREDVKWTYISPAADFQAEGDRTGVYTLAGEELTLNSHGESTISYADYAIAVVDEIESGQHIHERISVVSQ